MSINRVTITGNLTRDPELKANTNGTSILTFGVAVNDRRRNSQTGEWEDFPNFIDCVVFGQRADSLSRILKKGFKVAIEGKLRQNRWQDKNGQNRSRIEVVVDDLDFMQAKGQGGQTQAANQRQQPAPQQAYQNAQPAPLPTYQQPQQAQPAQPVQQAAQQPVQAVPVQAQPVAVQPVQQPVQVVQQPAAQQVIAPSQGEPASIYDPGIPF